MNTEQIHSAMRASGFEPAKQQFLMMILQQMNGKSSAEMLPAMLAAVNLARQKNISFNEQEIDRFTNIMKQIMSPEELERWTMIQNMMRGMRR